MGADLVKNVKRTSNIPRKDADVNTTGSAVVAKWKLTPAITLLWITPAQHESNVNAFNATLADRNITGGSRMAVTKTLKNNDTLIDKGVAGIKNLLVNKYEGDAASYYPQFGIEHVRKNFIIPRDRNKRLAALKLMVSGIAAHGFGTAKYGTAYWQPILDEYQTLMEQASKVDGTVSNKVSAKNELRKTIVKTHNALISVLKGNYPDTYKSVIREWGFQKEKY
jgi:hypothetical protein